MAILDNLPGIKATVYSNGYLDEYRDDNDWDLKGYNIPPPRNRASAYVQVIDDTDFTIKLDVTAPYISTTDLSFVGEVDRTLICMVRAKHEDMQRQNWRGQIDAYYRRIDAAQVISRPLKFCTLTKVDNADSTQVKTDAKLVAGVGEIIIYVHRTRPGNHDENPYISARDPKQVKEVSEKALKGQAISHSVGYGEERRVPRPKSQSTIFIDGKQNPLAVFRFKYRSKAALQAELIIPRSPSPDVVQFSRARDREERLSSLKKEIAKIKSEKLEDDSTSQKRSGSDIHNSGRAYKTSRRGDGNLVVDLTDD